MYKYLSDRPVEIQSELERPVSGRPKFEVLSVSSPDSEVVWCSGPRISLVFVASNGPDGQRCWIISGGRTLESWRPGRRQWGSQEHTAAGKSGGSRGV